MQGTALGESLTRPGSHPASCSLYRRYESVERQADGFDDPDALHAYETRAPRVIDFVCGPRKLAHLLEVKFQRGVTLATTQTMRKAFPRHPEIVASRDSLAFDGLTAVVPASLLLWALG